MKPRLPTNRFPAVRRDSSRRAFTMVEMMISLTIFTMVTGGIIYSHFIGTKMYNLSVAKMGGNDHARVAIGLMHEDIRVGKMIQVGMGNLGSFTAATNGALQQGNAIQIYLTTNYTTNYCRYYLDTNTARLVRTVNSQTTPELIAQNITNSTVFWSEDYAGNVLTASQNNRVIHFLLQFYQIQYPVLMVGTNKGSFDYYQISGRVTRRALE